MFDVFKQELDNLRQKTAGSSKSIFGSMALIGEAFKSTQDPMLSFVKNVAYGRLGLFRFISNTVSGLQALDKAVGAVKGTIMLAAPVFTALNNKLGITEKLSAVGGAIAGGVAGFGVDKASGTKEQVEKITIPIEKAINAVPEAINGLFKDAGIYDIMSNLKQLDFKGAFENLRKGGVINALLRLLIIFTGLTGKLVFIPLKILVFTITKTFSIFLPYLTYVLGIIIAAMVVVKLLYETAGVIFDVLKTVWAIAWPTISTVFGHIGDFLGVFFSAIGGIFGFIFGNTSLEEMLFGVFDLIPAFLDMVFGGGLALLIGLPTMIFGFFQTLVGSIWSRARAWWENSGKGDILMVVVGLVAFFMGGAFYVLLGTVLFYAAMWFWDRFGRFFSSGGAFWKGLKDWFGSAVGGLIDAISDWWDSIDFYANGGVATGGMAVVGERGPELVNLPRGARVHSNAQSRRMVATAQGGTIIHNNITINARDTSDGELRRIAERIGNMVNNKINRTTSSRTMR